MEDQFNTAGGGSVALTNLKCVVSGFPYLILHVKPLVGRGIYFLQILINKTAYLKKHYNPLFG